MILCCLFYIASAVPRAGQAYRAMPTLVCGMCLMVLDERGRVAKGEVFNDFT
jgi:hypothetical protein